MDPPSTPPAAAPPSSSATAVVPPPHHVSSYADSVESSPRSRNTDSWDEPLPPSAMRLRLMCSYGGHIVPRPHDKSLCYVGGDTRIVVVDRNSSLSDLHARLSKTLLNGRVFTLKYQLPSEDLDSLISVTTDEDLDNMIDEYDRTAHSSSNKPSRIRLFLFPSKPDLSQSIGPILDNPAKSEDWFLNALNGAAGMLNRGFSDSATVNCLLGLDDEGILGGGNLNNSNNMNNLDLGSRDDVSQPGSFTNFKKGGHDVHSVPDSPMLDTTSSFGSTSSSPSLANLPPIRVHVEDGGGGLRVQDQRVVGIEEQFAQMGISQSGQKQEESGFVLLSSPPPMPNTIVASAVPVSTVSAPVDYTNRVVSDDERSDQGLPIGYRKKPQPQVQVQVQAQNLPTQSQPKSTGFVDLPSPDSVSSDSSIANAISRSKPVIYQDQVAQIPSGTSRVPSANPVDPKLNISDQNARVQMQQFQDSGYVLQQQLDSRQHQQHHQQLQAQQQQHQQLQAHQQQHQQQAQQQQHQQAQQQQHQQAQQQQQQHQQQAQQQQHQQLQAQQQHQQLQAQQQQQFIHAGAHYFQQHPAGNVPISAYYPVYPSQQQQHHPHHPQLDQQYPVYYVPARQAQAYNNLSVQQQSNVSEATNSSRPQTHPNTTMVAPSAAYNPMRNTPLTKPENAAGMYRTATTAAPQLVQVPSSQHQQQYVGYSQIHHPSQSIAPTSAAPANYAYEYADASHAQIYYTQPLAPTMPSHSQYQTMTATGAVMMPEVSGQVPQDNMKQQQMRSS